MRLSQREQIHLHYIVDEYPGPLAEWIKKWIAAQQEVGTGGTFDITQIPVPKPEIVPDPTEFTNAVENRIAHPSFKVHGTVTGTTRPTVLAKQAKEDFLADLGYSGWPKNQRKAVRRFLFSTISLIEETDRLPDSPECWAGNHDIPDWEDLDCYLWVVTGKWETGNDLRKWACKECAEKIAATHPEAAVKAADA